MEYNRESRQWNKVILDIANFMLAFSAPVKDGRTGRTLTTALLLPETSQTAIRFLLKIGAIVGLGQGYQSYRTEGLLSYGPFYSTFIESRQGRMMVANGRKYYESLSDDFPWPRCEVVLADPVTTMNVCNLIRRGMMPPLFEDIGISPELAYRTEEWTICTNFDFITEYVGTEDEAPF